MLHQFPNVNNSTGDRICETVSFRLFFAEAKRLQQQAEQAELDRRNNLLMERERGKTTLAAASMPGSDQKFLNELEALRLKDPEAYKAKMATWNALKSASTGGRGQLTYDQASDNADKWMQSTTGMTEMSRMRKEAKEAGRPMPSAVEIRSQLIKDAMLASGSSYADKMPAAPSVNPAGKVKFLGFE